MTTTPSDPTFFTLAAEFVQRRRTDSECSVEQFADEHPHLRDEILEDFPGLLVAESLVDAKQEVTLPTKLGRYKVEREIGRGAMGIVVSGTNPDLESGVAIKLLPFGAKSSMEMLKRFHVEAKICAAMDHPNIVPVFDYGTDEDFAYLVMRKIPGKSLDKVIEGLAKYSVPTDSGGIEMDWDFVASIGIQAADALHYAHEQGVIHRDIKPGNLIMEKNGRLWVSDFGLSKVLGSDVQLSMTGDILGTPRYMAPEQLRGICNPGSDVYSLGMTLYELAAVHPLQDFGSDSTQLMIKSPTLELPNLKTINPAVPNALCEVIMQAVELRAEDRFASANALCIALKQSVEGSFIGDRRIKDRVAARRSWIRNFAIAGCVAVIASAGVYALRPTKDDLLADVLEEPEQVREILQKQEARDAIAEQLPELVETLFDPDTEASRTLVAELATSFMEAEMDSAYVSEEEKAKLQSQMEQVREAWIKYGINSPEYAALAQNQDQTLETIFQEQCGRLRRNVQKTDFSEKWKVHALQQISRYQAAVEGSQLSPQQESKIDRLLNFLPSEKAEAGDEPHLTSVSLQFFVNHIKSEMDTLGIPAATPSNAGLANNGSTKVEPPPAPNRQIQKDVDLGSLIKQIEDDPEISGLIEDALADPRLLQQLERANAAGRR